jgi:hypothetical protein
MRIKFPSNNWATPQSLYDQLNAQYKFSEFDPCPLNCDLQLFNGLTATWPKDEGAIFVNPPYDLAGKTAFVIKALEEVKAGLPAAVLLLPVSTSTKLFHEVILPFGTITYLNYRPKYEGINTRGEWVNPGLGRNTERLAEYCLEAGLKKVKSAGAHDSMIVVFT